MCYGGLWGSICPFAFGDSDAQVACRQLNYSAIGIYYLLVFLFFISSTGAVESNTFGKGVWPAHSLYFSCSGSEASLLSCTYYTSTCYYYYSYDTGIKCEGIIII